MKGVPMTREHQLEVMKTGGLHNVKDLARAADRAGLGLSAACALVLMESNGGENIFGADPGGDALPHRWFERKVTRLRYAIYRRRRNRGMVPNGVGPTQLTSATLQIEAERMGGCWKPYYNMVVGFMSLNNLIKQYGVQEGFTHFNGSGPEARAYGKRAVKLQQQWHNLLR